MYTETTKPSLLRTILTRLNDPSADRYRAFVGLRTFGRVSIVERKVAGGTACATSGSPARPHEATPCPGDSKTWTKLAS